MPPHCRWPHQIKTQNALFPEPEFQHFLFMENLENLRRWTPKGIPFKMPTGKTTSKSLRSLCKCDGPTPKKQACRFICVLLCSNERDSLNWKIEGFKDAKFQSSKKSKFQSVKLSKFQRSNVSTFQNFRNMKLRISHNIETHISNKSRFEITKNRFENDFDFLGFFKVSWCLPNQEELVWESWHVR